ncbi:hypothetical protein FHS01_000872 [Longimicrobium terrae]|uniref:Uncharacterized protein n=1 Tax=Longimicrobium terrae TaxID=1639882 RepID=A0A841GKY3_9BACT|nr:hypothetical protein [Longimicrobium terrae]MBB6069257.1 hypothetical protein [Longimicrobium terrae]
MRVLARSGPDARGPGAEVASGRISLAEPFAGNPFPVPDTPS